MPSIIIGNPVASGAQIVYSGNVWSGQAAKSPASEIRFKLSPAASGNVYLGLSGSLTLNSGGMLLSGGGLADGYVLKPGDEYRIPRAAFHTSGVLSVYARHDAECSGQARLYWEAF